MNWETCSVEARGRNRQAPDRDPVSTAKYATVSGMQNNELTMFRLSCYSSLVPRVHPGLLYAATFLRACVKSCGGALEKQVSG